MGVAVFFWLAGAWTTVPAGNFVLDAFGVPIQVGSTVKAIFTVTSVNALDTHFGAVAGTLKFPSGTKISPIQTIALDPGQLVVGS
jgi:hypothetical protein